MVGAGGDNIVIHLIALFCNGVLPSSELKRLTGPKSPLWIKVTSLGWEPVVLRYPTKKGGVNEAACRETCFPL